MLALNHNYNTPTLQQLDDRIVEQLISSINTLNKTIESKAKSIHDLELWTLEHIAQYCHLSIVSIRKITAKPSFPNPVLLAGELGQKIWYQAEVKQWVKQNQANLPKSRARK